VASATATLARTAGGALGVTWSGTVAITDPAATSLADGHALAELGALQPGTYVLRYLRDGTILAEGSFTVE
jgi:hypothetical protein